MIKWHKIDGISKRWRGLESEEEWREDPGLELFRASIPGGWLVASGRPGMDIGFSLSFVPDPSYTWDGTSTDYGRKVDG